MNELEQAAHDLVTHPAREPSPLTVIEARASEVHRRVLAVRWLSAATVVLLVVAGVGLAARTRGSGAEVQLGSTPPGNASVLHVRVTTSDATPIDATTLSVVAARLRAFGVSDAVISPDATSRSFDLRASGVTIEDARLLVETPGHLLAADLESTSGIDPCSSSARLPLDVGWPVAKATERPCYVGLANVEPVSGTASFPTGRTSTTLPSRPLRHAEARAEGKSWSVSIDIGEPTTGGSTPGTVGRSATMVAAPGLVFDRVLLRDPMASIAPRPDPGEVPAIEQTPSGWIVRGYTARDARLLVAVLSGGALDATLQVTTVDDASNTKQTVVGATVPATPGATTSSRPSPSLSTPIAPGSGAQLALYVQGSDEAIASALDHIRDRFERLGLHARWGEVGAMLANGSGKRPVTLTLDTGESPTTPAAQSGLQDLFVAMERPGVPAFGPVRSSQPISSHYPTACKLAAWGGECYLLGDEVSAPRLVSGAQELDGRPGLDVSLASPGALDGLVRTCRAREASCPTGDLAFTVDGLVIGVVAANTVEPGAAHVAVAAPQPLPSGATAEYMVMLLSGPLRDAFMITFSPDPTPGPGSPSVPEVPTTAPGPGNPTTPTTPPALPVPTDPAGESTTTAPGPGATAPTCPPFDPLAPVTTQGPNC